MGSGNSKKTDNFTKIDHTTNTDHTPLTMFVFILKMVNFEDMELTIGANLSKKDRSELLEEIITNYIEACEFSSSLSIERGSLLILDDESHKIQKRNNSDLLKKNTNLIIGYKGDIKEQHIILNEFFDLVNVNKSVTNSSIYDAVASTMSTYKKDKSSESVQNKEQKGQNTNEQYPKILPIQADSEQLGPQNQIETINPNKQSGFDLTDIVNISENYNRENDTLVKTIKYKCGTILKADMKRAIDTNFDYDFTGAVTLILAAEGKSEWDNSIIQGNMILQNGEYKIEADGSTHPVKLNFD